MQYTGLEDLAVAGLVACVSGMAYFAAWILSRPAIEADRHAALLWMRADGLWISEYALGLATGIEHPGEALGYLLDSGRVERRGELYRYIGE